MKDREMAREIFRLRAGLLSQGITLTGFARREKFDRTLVLKVIQAYWGTDREPRGPISRAILAKLREYVGPELLPEVEEEGGSSHESPPDDEASVICSGEGERISAGH